MPHSGVVRQVDDVLLDLLSTMAVSSLILRCATIPEFVRPPPSLERSGRVVLVVVVLVVTVTWRVVVVGIHTCRP